MSRGVGTSSRSAQAITAFALNGRPIESSPSRRIAHRLRENGRGDDLSTDGQLDDLA